MFSCVFFFFKQKTAYEMRISDWSSDVCSSDLIDEGAPATDRSSVGGVAPTCGCGGEFPPSNGCRRYRSEGNAAGEDVLEHNPVPDDRIDRMLERRRPVLLAEEVSHPGETVAAQEPAEQPTCVARTDTHPHPRETADDPNKNKPRQSAHRIVVSVEEAE